MIFAKRHKLENSMYFVLFMINRSKLPKFVLSHHINTTNTNKPTVLLNIEIIIMPKQNISYLRI